MKVDIVLTITYPMDAPEKFRVTTNARVGVVEELLSSFVRDQMGRGKDERPAVERDALLEVTALLSDDRVRRPIGVGLEAREQLLVELDPHVQGRALRFDLAQSSGLARVRALERVSFRSELGELRLRPHALRGVLLELGADGGLRGRRRGLRIRRALPGRNNLRSRLGDAHEADSSGDLRRGRVNFSATGATEPAGASEQRRRKPTRSKSASIVSRMRAYSRKLQRPIPKPRLELEGRRWAGQGSNLRHAPCKSR